EHLVAVQPGQQEIEHDDRVVLGLHEAQRVLAVRGNLELKTVRLQGTGNETADALLVVDDEDSAHRHPPGGPDFPGRARPMVISLYGRPGPPVAQSSAGESPAQIRKLPARDMSAA